MLIPPAFAGTSSPTDNQCNITTGASSRGCVAGATGAITNATVCQNSTTCDAVRSDPGFAAAPIDVAGICRYVDNAATSGKSIFVPFHRNSSEWSSFVNNVQASNSFITLTTCSRADSTLQVPANYPTYPNGTANPFYVAQPAPNDMTCNTAQAQIVNLPYARTGTLLTTGTGTLAAVTFTCMVPGYSCLPNGGACGTNQTWTETATASFTAGTSPDGATTPSGWKLTGVTYGGGPKPIPQSGCTATTLSWIVNGMTCSGPASTTTNSSSITVSSTNSNTGTATFNCPATGTTFAATPQAGATCSAPQSCGSAADTASVNQPASNLCGDGSTPSVTLSGSTWQWSCGTNSCSANRCPDGESYWATAFNLTVGVNQTLPLAYQSCQYGLLSGGINKGSQTTDGNTTLRCQPGCYPAAPPASAVNGACGSDNGQTLAAAPTNLCTSGTASAVTGTGPWSWSCAGSNGGATATCSASAAVSCTWQPTVQDIARYCPQAMSEPVPAQGTPCSYVNGMPPPFIPSQVDKDPCPLAWYAARAIDTNGMFCWCGTGAAPIGTDPSL